MVLVCNVCVPKADDWGYTDKDKGNILVMAKWYPGGMGEEGAAYYSNRTAEQVGQEFLDFLEKHKHGEVESEHYTKGAGQENPVRLEYESYGKPVTK